MKSSFATPLFLTLALVLAGCQCGPGISCKTNDQCAPWGTCSSGGFCVAKPGSGTDGGGDTDGGEDGGNGGPPKLALIDQSVALGNVGCGTELNGTLNIRNDGETELFLAVSSSQSVFQVPMSLSIPAGMTVPLNVIGRVPSSAFAGQEFQGILTLDTNDPLQRKVLVPLSMTATGVTLTATPPLASFGLVPLNVQAPDVPMQLRNSGTQTATVALAMSGDAQFELTPRMVSIDAGTTVEVTARFRPTDVTPSRIDIGVTPTEPVCGTPLTALTLSGQGTTGLVGLSTNEVFFGDNGRVACGARATAQTIALTNAGNAPFAWTSALSLASNSPFTLNPSSGTVPAMQTVMINITTTAIPATAPTNPDGFGDLLTLTTDAPNDMPHQIQLHQSAHGAVLRLSPTNVQYGGVPIGSSATAPVNLVNEGSGTVNVTWAAGPSAFTLEPNAPSLASVGSQAATVRFTPSSGLDASVEMGTLTLSIVPDSGVLCDVVPAAVQLQGTGTSGSVAYSPVALDFGSTNCGATAMPKVITFTNPGNQAYKVTAALTAMTPKYTLSMSPPSGDVAPDGGTMRLTVTPLPIPQTSAITNNLYGDLLHITTDVNGDLPRDIPLTQTARGSIFSLSTQLLDFGDVARNTVATAQFTLTNTGNAPGTLQFAPGQSVFSLPASQFVAGGSSATIVGSFSPVSATSAVTDEALLTVPGSTVLCQPLPAPMTPAGPPRLPLAGRGVASVVVVQSVTQLTFGTNGLVPCGTTAMAKTFTLRNDSTQNLNLMYMLSGASGSYTVTGPPMVNSGATATVTVTPRMIPTTSETTTDLYAATVTVNATGTGFSEQHTVALHMTAQGARLSFNPTQLRNLGTQNFTVVNSGNGQATFTLALSNTNNNYSFTPSGMVMIAGNANVGGSVTFDRALLQLGTVTNTLSMGTNSTLCAPLPSAMQLTSDP
ncbi:MAG: choice-of-anchor D domain-containing protein [Archangium sp.]